MNKAVGGDCMEQYLQDLKNSKLVIYTIIVGDYDTLKDPEYIDENCDYICFTDNKELSSKTWQIRLVENIDLDNTRLQRMYKVLPHKFLSEYKYSLYIDGNVRIIGSMRDFVRSQWNGASLLGLKHPSRDNIYDEAEACINLNKDDPNIIRNQMNRYKKEGYQANNGLAVTNILFRKHNEEQLIKVMEDWWSEIRDYSRRDQLSFGYACWKNDFKYDVSDLKCYRSEYWQNPGIHTNNIRDVEKELIDHIQFVDYQQYLISEKDKSIAIKEQEKADIIAQKEQEKADLIVQKEQEKSVAVAKKEQELAKIKNRLKKRIDETEELKAYIKCMESSLSWRCTAIFRKIFGKQMQYEPPKSDLILDLEDRFEEIENNLKNSFDWLNYRIDDLVYEKIMIEGKIDHNYYKTLNDEELIYELKRWYYIKTGKKLDLENPTTFDEKIQWLKIYDRNPLKGKLADKATVREYIEQEIGGQYLIPIIGTVDFFDQIDFGQMPDQFVLKCNHGSGWNEIVRDKSQMDIPKIKRNFNYWMSLDYAFYSGFQMQYKDMERKILIEQYIEQADGNLYDYKIHCFMGVPKIIQVIGDRDNQIHMAKQAFYDIYWNRLDMDTGDYPLYSKELSAPSKLDEMLVIAKKLSKPFRYVRIDLYEINNQVKFGEFSFTPNSGIHQWSAESINAEWGSMVILD